MKNQILKICYKILKKYGVGLYHVREGIPPFIELPFPEYNDTEWHTYVRTIVCKFRGNKNHSQCDNLSVYERGLTKKEIETLCK